MVNGEFCSTQYRYRTPAGYWTNRNMSSDVKTTADIETGQTFRSAFVTLPYNATEEARDTYTDVYLIYINTANAATTYTSYLQELDVTTYGSSPYYFAGLVNPNQRPNKYV